MTIDRDLLLSAVNRNHLSFRELSVMMKITPTSFSRKLKCQRFTLKELHDMKNTLHLTDKEVISIFFAKAS